MRGLEIVTVLVVSVAMSLALAHALEWPGKRRLNREAYLSCQTIYYPGFTFGGASEGIALLLLLLLAWRLPRGGTSFVFVTIALACLAAMHVVFWVVTQPTNKFWLANTTLSKAGSAFFRAGAAGQQSSQTSDPDQWLALRRRWEYSHIVRAVLALCSLTSLLAAVVD
jgi:hypothetical protein